MSDFDTSILINYAQAKNGSVDISYYSNNRSFLTWTCHNSHSWQAQWCNISTGKWCPSCSKNKKLSIQDAYDIAAKYQGKCLSTNYINNRSKLEFECKNKHTFKMHLNSIRQNGSWCPYCRNWSSEEICRTFFETIFQKKFIKCRPDWLINSNYNKLELDGFNEELKIAFEHNGLQHYDAIETSWKTFSQEDLDKIKSHDQIKQELCRQYNIKLIVIPQLFRITKINELKSFLKQEFIKQNIVIPANYDELIINYNHLYVDNFKYKQLKKLVLSKKGILLSGYINALSNVEIQCEKGHIFKQTPNSIKNGSWCQSCRNVKIITLDYVKDFISNKNGTLLSSIYKNNCTPLKIACNICNFTWESNFNRVSSLNSWCPFCKGGCKLTLQHAHCLAHKYNGICLSKRFNKDSIKWKCQNNHFFKTSYLDAKKNWCPSCKE